MKKVTELEMIKISSETWYPIVCKTERVREIFRELTMKSRM